MDERQRRSREIHDKIGRILYEDWDPLGVRGSAPSDEYDSYIDGVCSILAGRMTLRETYCSSACPANNRFPVLARVTAVAIP